ncbi:hypothetical protein MTO96_003059 [Rhipicephalus appendiculatus]
MAPLRPPALPPSLGVSRKCRLRCIASSTVAEMAAINLAADLIEEFPAIHQAAILTDSRAALAALEKGETRSPLGKRLYRKHQALQTTGCDIILHWTPAHVGVSGNEAADTAAKQAHSPETSVCDFVHSGDVDKLLIARYTRKRHRDP